MNIGELLITCKKRRVENSVIKIHYRKFKWFHEANKPQNMFKTVKTCELYKNQLKKVISANNKYSWH